MSAEAGIQRVLARQLNMNAETWEALKRHGVTEETELRLDFFYFAPDRGVADELARFLADETDYDIEVAEGEGGDWTVQGSTQSTAVSRDILDQWVKWMVFAGYEHGRCEFDGWGAALPSG
jgi:hypothetical protein